MKSLTMFRVEVLLSQISIFILISIFHVKCRPTVTLQSIGGFGLIFLNLTTLIQSPGSATGILSWIKTDEVGWHSAYVSVLLITIYAVVKSNCAVEQGTVCTKKCRGSGLNHYLCIDC